MKRRDQHALDDHRLEQLADAIAEEKQVKICPVCQYRYDEPGCPLCKLQAETDFLKLTD